MPRSNNKKKNYSRIEKISRLLAANQAYISCTHMAVYDPYIKRKKYN